MLAELGSQRRLHLASFFADFRHRLVFFLLFCLLYVLAFAFWQCDIFSVAIPMFSDGKFYILLCIA